MQFGAFLSSHLSPEEYSRRVFDLDLLIKDYRIPGDIAFFLYRPKLSSAIGVRQQYNIHRVDLLHFAIHDKCTLCDEKQHHLSIELL